jgi:hypothetical protein
VRPIVESAMRAEIFRKRHPEVVWTIVIGRFVRLLRVVAMPREEAIEKAWKDLGSDDRFHRRKPDI